MKADVQRALYCRCRNEKILALGLCATCYTLKRQDEEYFGGLREAVLERDGYCCRVCGASGRRKRSIVVHDRVQGKSLLHLMISQCLRCHAKVGRTKCVLSEMPHLLFLLWRKQHPNGHEQVMIDFMVTEMPAEPVALIPEENRLEEQGRFGSVSLLALYIRVIIVLNYFITSMPFANFFRLLFAYC